MTAVITEDYHCYQLHTKCYPIFLSQGYIEEITGYHQCGFQHNRSITDQIFCIHQILETAETHC
jgi:hypothetical protein